MHDPQFKATLEMLIPLIIMHLSQLTLADLLKEELEMGNITFPEEA